MAPSVPTPVPCPVPRPVPRPRARARGFTYLGLLILVTVIGLVGAATLKVEALLRRAAAERDLLDIGAAFSEALRSYADATPRGQPTQPPSLQDLLRDPRYPGVKRHLRKIFVDPMTGKAEWGIVYAGGVGADIPTGAAGAAAKPAASLFGSASTVAGATATVGNGGVAPNGSGILAIYSLSQARPLKQTNFDARFQNLDNKTRISDWKFAALGQGVTTGPQPAAAGPGSGSAQVQAPAPLSAQATPAPDQPSLFPNRDAAPATEPQARPADPAPALAPTPARDAPAPSQATPPADTPPKTDAADTGTAKSDADPKDAGDGRVHAPPLDDDRR